MARVRLGRRAGRGHVGRSRKSVAQEHERAHEKLFVVVLVAWPEAACMQLPEEEGEGARQNGGGRERLQVLHLHEHLRRDQQQRHERTRRALRARHTGRRRLCEPLPLLFGREHELERVAEDRARVRVIVQVRVVKEQLALELAKRHRYSQRRRAAVPAAAVATEPLIEQPRCRRLRRSLSERAEQCTRVRLA